MPPAPAALGPAAPSGRCRRRARPGAAGRPRSARLCPAPSPARTARLGGGRAAGERRGAAVGFPLVKEGVWLPRLQTAPGGWTGSWERAHAGSCGFFAECCFAALSKELCLFACLFFPGEIPAVLLGAEFTWPESEVRSIEKENKKQVVGSKMEEAEEDDMACGDLGNGLGRRPGGVYEGEKLQNYSFRSRKASVKAYNTFSSIKGVEENDATPLPCSKRNSFHDGSSKQPLPRSTRQSSCGKANLEFSVHQEKNSWRYWAVELLHKASPKLDSAVCQNPRKDSCFLGSSAWDWGRSLQVFCQCSWRCQQCKKCSACWR